MLWTVRVHYGCVINYFSKSLTFGINFENETFCYFQNFELCDFEVCNGNNSFKTHDVRFGNLWLFPTDGYCSIQNLVLTHYTNTLS